MTFVRKKIGLTVFLVPLLACTVGDLPQNALTGDLNCSLQVMQRLYFGTEIPSGGEVKAVQWEDFLSKMVTPHFPSGFTVYSTNGQWLSRNGSLIKESSFVLEVVHDNSAAHREAIREISQEYKARFHQDSVLLLTLPVTACF